MTSRRALLTTSGALWIAGALVYVGGEAITASAFPDYSYAHHYISDLGVPDVGVFEGRDIDSPLHLVMNTAFVVQGILFLLAAWFFVRAAAVRLRGLLLGLAAVFAVGLSLVGVVHGSRESLENGLAAVHLAGAAMAILGGNGAAIIAGVTVRPGLFPTFYRWACVVIGVIGLVGVVMLRIDSAASDWELFPDGTWERIAVYTITLWQVLTGILLLRRRRR
jgi:hypothetical membrane protein